MQKIVEEVLKTEAEVISLVEKPAEQRNNRKADQRAMR